MSFKTWLFNEMPSMTLPSPLLWKGEEIDLIDFRSEDWEINDDDPRAEEAYQIKQLLKSPWNQPSVYGRIPGKSDFLYYDGKKASLRVAPSRPSHAVCLDDLPLKRNWWEYIQGTDHQNHLVKAAGRVRDTENINF